MLPQSDFLLSTMKNWDLNLPGYSIGSLNYDVGKASYILMFSKAAFAGVK